MKTGVLPRNWENGSSGSCTPSNSNPSNSVSNDSGGGASAWGNGGKKGRSGFAASLRKDHKQSSLDMVRYMYVIGWSWREWGEGKEEMDEREMMSEMRDSRSAAQSATVLTQTTHFISHFSHFSFRQYPSLHDIALPSRVDHIPHCHHVRFRPTCTEPCGSSESILHTGID